MADHSEYGPPVDPIAPLRAALRGRYDIEREIGQGAFATVYLARDLKHERKVALKVLNADPTSETGELRFIREIGVLARLQHPNILPLHDSGHVEALLYYVMPYVAGETLRDRINRERQLETSVACGIAREIADALAYAHSQGIIHRDIKPENILLSAGHPIVADFGIARAIDLAGVRQLTRTGTGSPGTPAYMSPEQLMGDRAVDARSDTYSLGCVLYEMLAGKPPFMGKDGFVKRFTDPPPRISSVRRGLPGSLDDVIAKALEKNPGDRYQSAVEFVTALGPPSLGGSILNPRPSGAEAASAQPAYQAPRDGPSAVRESEFPHTRSSTERTAVQRVWSRHRTLIGVSILVAIILSLAIANRVAAIFRQPELDSGRVVVFPFRGDPKAGEAIRRRFEDALSNWQDLHVTSDVAVAEVLPNGRTPSSLSEARALAKTLGARRLVWGEVYSSGANSSARAELYDLADERQSGPRAVGLSDPASDSSAILTATLALLKDPQRPSLANGGDGGTRSFVAWSAYGSGHVALAQWDLPAAERAFADAVAADPNFVAARAWLAQLIEWTRYGDPAWQAHANRAEEGVNELPAPDRFVAAALASLARSDFPTACASYRDLSRSMPASFIGWYGLGECERLDDVVVPDSRSESGWSFRTSLRDAFRMYSKALQLEPRAHALLNFDKVKLLLPISASSTRPGHGPNAAIFAAFPSLQADTIAFVPYPLARFAALPGEATFTHNAALDRNSDILLDFTRSWSRQFPQSVDAQESLADVLEARGEVSDMGAGRPSAMGAVLTALAAASDPTQRLRLTIREVRLRFKRSEFAKAEALADSLLRNHTVTGGDDAGELIGLAAMTGRIDRTARLAREGGWKLLSTSVAIPGPVADVSASLFARSALGVCGQETLALERRLENALQSYVPDNQREEIGRVLTDRSLSMRVPCTDGQSALRISSPQDRLYRMQQAYARRTFSVIRSTFDSLGSMRRASRPGDLALDYTYQEAWLRVAMGDTVGAIRQLDLALGALPTLGAEALKEVGAAAAIGRSMALRAELAHSQRDDRTARQWASALAALWRNSDPELQPTVARMQQLAAGGNRN